MLPFTAHMSLGLPMIAGLVPFGLPYTNSITFLLICHLCTLLVFAIKWYWLEDTFLSLLQFADFTSLYMVVTREGEANTDGCIYAKTCNWIVIVIANNYRPITPLQENSFTLQPGYAQSKQMVYKCLREGTQKVPTCGRKSCRRVHGSIFPVDIDLDLQS